MAATSHHHRSSHGLQIDGILARADADGNATIDLEEFISDAPKTLKTNLIKLAKQNGADLGFLS